MGVKFHHLVECLLIFHKTVFIDQNSRLFSIITTIWAFISHYSTRIMLDIPKLMMPIPCLLLRFSKSFSGPFSLLSRIEICPGQYPAGLVALSHRDDPDVFGTDISERCLCSSYKGLL
jgi:hypothetical protein